MPDWEEDPVLMLEGVEPGFSPIVTLVIAEDDTCPVPIRDQCAMTDPDELCLVIDTSELTCDDSVLITVDDGAMGATQIRIAQAKNDAK